MIEWVRRLFRPIEGEAWAAGHDPSVLVCEFRGVIRDGGSGNSQVDLMERTIIRAMGARKFRALVLDIGRVRYTFGDHIFNLLWSLKRRGMAAAVVVSDECRQVGEFATLIGGWSVCETREEAFEKVARNEG